jgi:hypothetical protein
VTAHLDRRRVTSMAFMDVTSSAASVRHVLRAIASGPAEALDRRQSCARSWTRRPPGSYTANSTVNDRHLGDVG